MGGLVLVQITCVGTKNWLLITHWSLYDHWHYHVRALTSVGVKSQRTQAEVVR